MTEQIFKKYYHRCICAQGRTG